MYCKKCGTKNNDDSKFCVECGEDLVVSSGESEEAVISKPSDKLSDSIFRKALKRDARDKPKGSLYGMIASQIGLTILLILLVFLSIGGAIANGSFNAGTVLAFSGLIFLAIIVYFLGSMIISVGMMKSSLVISRGENISFASAFKGVFKDFNWTLKAVGGWILYSFGIGILSMIPIVGAIAALILQVYILPVVVVFCFMALDAKHENKNMTDMFHKSMELVNGHRVEFYGLVLSFIGWMILAIFTLGILYIWLVPYMLVAMSNWYLALKGEVKYDDGESGISNIAIIAISLISYFVFVFVVVFAAIVYIIIADINSDSIEDGFDNITNDIIGDSATDDSSKKGTVINMSGIEVFVPSDYKETTMTNYDKIYKSPYGEIYIGTNAQAFAGATDDFVQTLLAQYATMGFECGSEEVRNFNNEEWVNFTCAYEGNTDVHLYITNKNGMLRYLIVTNGGDLGEGRKLLDNIEKNLKLAN